MKFKCSQSVDNFSFKKPITFDLNPRFPLKIIDNKQTAKSKCTPHHAIGRIYRAANFLNHPGGLGTSIKDYSCNTRVIKVKKTNQQEELRHIFTKRSPSKPLSVNKSTQSASEEFGSDLPESSLCSVVCRPTSDTGIQVNLYHRESRNHIRYDKEVVITGPESDSETKVSSSAVAFLQQHKFGDDLSCKDKVLKYDPKLGLECLVDSATCYSIFNDEFSNEFKKYDAKFKSKYGRQLIQEGLAESVANHGPSHTLTTCGDDISSFKKQMCKSTNFERPRDSKEKNSDIRQKFTGFYHKSPERIGEKDLAMVTADRLLMFVLICLLVVCLLTHKDLQNMVKAYVYYIFPCFKEKFEPEEISLIQKCLKFVFKDILLLPCQSH